MNKTENKRAKKPDFKKQNIEVSVYFNISELEQLDQNRDRFTRSKFLRETALDTLPPTPPIRIDNSLVRELAKIGGNLNQIARYSNQKKGVDIDVLKALKVLENKLENTLYLIVENAKK